LNLVGEGAIWVDEDLAVATFLAVLALLAAFENKTSGGVADEGGGDWLEGLSQGVLAELGILLFDIDATGEADILPRARVIGVGPGLEGVTCLLGGLPERPASNAIGLRVEYRCSVAERVWADVGVRGLDALDGDGDNVKFVPPFCGRRMESDFRRDDVDRRGRFDFESAELDSAFALGGLATSNSGKVLGQRGLRGEELRIDRVGAPVARVTVGGV